MSHGNPLLWNLNICWEDLYRDKEFHLVNGSDCGFMVTSGAQSNGKHGKSGSKELPLMGHVRKVKIQRS
jgi:hypothetical protein